MTVQFGSSTHEVLLGSSSDNILFGAGGDDLLFGGPGNDFLYGGFGDDTLIGGRGNDLLYGGMGDDLLYGGEGSDIYLLGLDNSANFMGSQTLYMDESVDAQDYVDILLTEDTNSFAAEVVGFNENDVIKIQALGTANYKQSYVINTGTGDSILYISHGHFNLSTIRFQGVEASFVEDRLAIV